MLRITQPTQTPTMRWVFQMFEGVDLLLILQDDQVVQQKVLNLSPDHLQIIRLLGEQVQNCYSPPGCGVKSGFNKCLA